MCSRPRTYSVSPRFYFPQIAFTDNFFEDSGERKRIFSLRHFKCRVPPTHTPDLDKLWALKTPNIRNSCFKITQAGRFTVGVSGEEWLLGQCSEPRFCFALYCGVCILLASSLRMGRLETRTLHKRLCFLLASTPSCSPTALGLLFGFRALLSFYDWLTSIMRTLLAWLCTLPSLEPLIQMRLVTVLSLFGFASDPAH